MSPLEDHDDEYEPGPAEPRRWPLTSHGLYPRERWRWFEQLWNDVCSLQARFGLPVRSGWWESQLEIEALAALAAWAQRYDSGEWDDPPGKLALLYDLGRVARLLGECDDENRRRDFDEGRDLLPFTRYLIRQGCQPPPAHSQTDSSD